LYSPTLKRLFDLLVTIPALLVLAPFLLALALLVRLQLGTNDPGLMKVENIIRSS